MNNEETENHEAESRKHKEGSSINTPLIKGGRRDFLSEK